MTRVQRPFRLWHGTRFGELFFERHDVAPYETIGAFIWGKGEGGAVKGE